MRKSGYRILKFILIAFVLLSLSTARTTIAQIESLSLGVNAGIGQIKGNSPSVTSFSGIAFIDADPDFFNPLTFRFTFIYARKVEYFLPENRTGRYYPFVKGFTLKLYLYQSLSEKFYLDYGLGPLVLNDRTFSDTDVWNVGIAFASSVNLDLRESSDNGFAVGLGVEFGGTFSNTFARYSSVHLQGQYFIF